MSECCETCDAMRVLLDAERSARLKADAEAVEMRTALQEAVRMLDALILWPQSWLHQPDRIKRAIEPALASDASSALLAAFTGLYEALNKARIWIQAAVREGCLPQSGAETFASLIAALDAAKPWLPEERSE